MSVRTQLLLNALCLPCEMIHLIKEFAWMDVMVLTKRRKSLILTGISLSRYTSTYAYPTYHVFWIEGERYQFQSYFCDCGQYIASNSKIVLKCKCTCNFV